MKTQASYKIYLSLIYYLKQTYIPNGVLPYEYLYHCPALCQIICVCVCVNGESEGKCESWTIKKAEWGRIDTFEPWCWRRLLRVPWTTRRSNQSILKEINPEYMLERLILKLKLQYFGHLM